MGLDMVLVEKMSHMEKIEENFRSTVDQGRHLGAGACPLILEEKNMCKKRQRKSHEEIFAA